MQVEDAGDFLETHRASILGIAAADYPAEVVERWALPVTKTRIQEFLDNPDEEVRVVAELDGVIVGMGAVVVRENQLRACYVRPEGARQGVGTRIVRELERIARQHGIERFFLVSTTTAERFYNRLGYRSDKRIQHISSTGVVMDAIEMSKEL
jgi:N-acetylglutamate synthase-like GNAT family acetyltransferase